MKIAHIFYLLLCFFMTRSLFLMRQPDFRALVIIAYKSLKHFVSKPVVWRCFSKKVLLKILQNSQKTTMLGCFYK